MTKQQQKQIDKLYEEEQKKFVEWKRKENPKREKVRILLSCQGTKSKKGSPTPATPRSLQWNNTDSLDHAAHESVDVVLALAALATLVEVQQLPGVATVGGGQLEGPKEVGGLLEGGAHSEDLKAQHWKNKKSWEGISTVAR